MRHCLIFCAMLTTACEHREPVFVERKIPTALVTPCAEPVKSPPSQGALIELTLGWKNSAQCNADKLRSIAALFRVR